MMPHVDDNSRKKFYNDLEKKAYPNVRSEGKAVSNKELMELLSRR